MAAVSVFFYLTIVPAILSVHCFSFAQDTPRFGNLFERIDSNSDGKLTPAEAKAAGRKSDWIGVADTDGDGAVTLAEVEEYLGGKAKGTAGAAEPFIVSGDLSAESPVTAAGLRKAGEYSAKQNGETFLVMADGDVIYQRYDQGWKAEQSHRLASGTKSFSAALLAAGVKDGLLTIDEPVSATISEWEGKEHLSTVTIRQLLSLTSGMDPGKVGNVPAYSEAPKVTAISAPGAKFRYGPAAFQLFGELMTRKLKAREDLDFTDPLAYLEARVFKPIGLKYGVWRRDENGMPNLPSGALLTARDWVKYGEFLRNGGAWNGEQLVDAATLRECLKGTKANPGYGLTIWLLDGPKKKGVPWMKGAYMAAGAGKQRLIVLPAVGMVIVRQGESKRFDNEPFLKALFSPE